MQKKESVSSMKKRITALLLAMVMTLAMSISAFASDDASESSNDARLISMINLTTAHTALYTNRSMMLPQAFTIQRRLHSIRTVDTTQHLHYQ